VRTLGAANPARNLRRRPVAILVAVVVAGGFALVPLAVYFGLLR
jgi:hypothetical protein